MTNIKCTKESDRNHNELRTSKQHEQNKNMLVSVLVAYYILLSFDFVLYAYPGFIIVLVFLVPHIKLVYLDFFIQIEKLKNSIIILVTKRF